MKQEINGMVLDFVYKNGWETSTVYRRTRWIEVQKRKVQLRKF